MSNKKQNTIEAQILRKEAEKKLKEKKIKADIWVAEADTKKLMHELQVHQVELQMQNEALKEAYEISEEALKKYTLLYEFAPVGFFTLTSDGSIHELNFTGAEILGEKRFALVDSNFKLFVSEKSRPVFNTFLDKVFTTHAKESCVVKIASDKEPLSLLYIEGIVPGDEKNCLLSVVDITGFKKMNLL